ncbi:MAG: IS1182 family transposase [Candidatus Omnitrophota bacterium]|nr:IS1182 family transposase [Candidatus Omnitrophota bacterium]
MAYIKGNRNQMMLLPQAVEDYIAKDDPVRAYDAFVEALDRNGLGLVIDENQPGANPYWPKAMLKLLIYGYSYGIRSSRKLERACYHNLAFIWLTEDIKPDYRTIARFRIANRAIIKNVLRQCAHMCLKLGLIEGNTLFVDGTKIKANASLKNTWSKERLQKHEVAITENIERILAECEAVDNDEANSGSLIKLKKDLADQEALKAAIAEIAKELKESGKQKLNTADPDSFVSKSDRGAKMYHNAQTTVDEKHGLIVNTDVVNQSVDANQLSIQVKQAQDTLDKKPENICADNGYYSIDDIEKMDAEINVIIPSQGQLVKERAPDKIKPFPKDVFTYDDKSDCYICPENKELRRTELTIPNKPNAIIYQAGRRDCKSCKHFGVCTTSANGRKIIRQTNETLMQRLAQIYDSDTGQRIYKLRKQKVELPFAHFKHNMNIRQLLLRGIAKAAVELNLCAIGYNLTRMISLLGVTGLKEAIITV